MNMTLNTPDMLLLLLLESFVHFGHPKDDSTAASGHSLLVSILSNICFLELVPLCGLAGLGWQYIEKKI